MKQATAIGILIPLVLLCLADALRTWGWAAVGVALGILTAVPLVFAWALYSEQPDPVMFVCEDPECREKWQGAVETHPCEIEGCNIIGCPSCRTVCFFCDAAICSAHRVKYNDDGNERWTCAPCKQVAEARDREDGRQRRAS